MKPQESDGTMSNENTENIESMETSFGSHSLDEEDRMQFQAREERAKRLLVDDLTKKLDHILYSEWDPIGVHLLEEWNCFDEYHRYLPDIVKMVRAGSSRSDISDQLMLVESYMKGDDSNRRRCDVIAAMVSSYGPHASENPFQPVVNIDTPESAYQSVLDLVTQTRLDAYEKRWDEVRIGYEKAIEICHTFLPERIGLVGTCLNNLGHAYSNLGQLDKAQEKFEKALPKLKLESESEEPLYLLCLNNLIVNLEHRRKFSAAVPHVKALISHYDQTVGGEDEQTVLAKERLDRLAMTDQPPVSLVCSRISVEQDESDVISNVIIID